MLRLLATLPVLFCIAFQSANDHEFRTWQSANGKFSTEAKLISFSHGVAKIKTTTGNVIDVEADQLREADHVYIVKSTGWGRVWKSIVGARYLIADLREVNGDTVFVEKIDGRLFEVAWSDFDKADQKYIQQRRPSDFNFDSISYPAKVVGVSDGDTVTILVNGQQHNLRLIGIYAPESGQAFYHKAKQKLSNLVFDKDVLVRGCGGKDKYSRLLGDIEVDGKNVSLEMVASGYAWHFKKYSDNEKLSQAEVAAQNEKRGLWSESGPIPLWEIRTMGPEDRRQYALALQEKSNRARAPPDKAEPSKPNGESIADSKTETPRRRIGAKRVATFGITAHAGVTATPSAEDIAVEVKVGRAESVEARR